MRGQALFYIMKILILILILLFSGCVVRYSEAFDKQKQVDLELLVESFSQCQGIYKAYAEFMDLANYPDNAENTRGYMRGAHAAATYILTLQKRVKEPGVKFKMGVFSPYIDSLAFGTYNQVKALIEQNDMKEANKHLKKCLVINGIQADVIGELRKEMYGLP